MKKLTMIGLLYLLAGCSSLSNGNMFGLYSQQSLTEAVSMAFMDNELLVGQPIKIEAEHGVVRLSGYVKTIKQSDVAAEVASKVRGVKMVENHLIVRK